jgi:hypothetical protein
MSSIERVLRGRARVAMIAVAAAVAVWAVAFAPDSSGAAPATPRCSTFNLRLDKIGENDFTSHRGWNFALRNIGPTTCHLKGYPNVRLLDAHARVMPTRMHHFAGPPHNVVLAPWRRAFFSVTFAVSGPCPAAVFAYGMRVVPPHDAPRLVHYAGRFDLCGPGPAVLSISPVASSPL